MTIDGVPSTGFVALTDDSNELVSVSSGIWGWSPDFTDGGVIGGLDGSWKITITINSSTGIDQWYFLDGTSPNNPDRIQLDITQALVVRASIP